MHTENFREKLLELSPGFLAVLELMADRAWFLVCGVGSSMLYEPEGGFEVFIDGELLKGVLHGRPYTDRFCDTVIDGTRLFVSVGYELQGQNRVPRTLYALSPAVSVALGREARHRSLCDKIEALIRRYEA